MSDIDASDAGGGARAVATIELADLDRPPEPIEAVRRLRTARRANRVAAIEWFELAYRAYLSGLIGIIAVLSLAGAIGDSRLPDASMIIMKLIGYTNLRANRKQQQEEYQAPAPG